MKTKKEKETSESIKEELDVLLNLNKKRRSALEKMSKSLKEIKHKTKNH